MTAPAKISGALIPSRANYRFSELKGPSGRVLVFYHADNLAGSEFGCLSPVNIAITEICETTK
jgi:hypothetical protein